MIDCAMTLLSLKTSVPSTPSTGIGKLGPVKVFISTSQTRRNYVNGKGVMKRTVFHELVQCCTCHLNKDANVLQTYSLF